MSCYWVRPRSSVFSVFFIIAITVFFLFFIFFHLNSRDQVIEAMSSINVFGLLHDELYNVFPGKSEVIVVDAIGLCHAKHDGERGGQTVRFRGAFVSRDLKQASVGKKTNGVSTCTVRLEFYNSDSIFTTTNPPSTT